MIHGVLNSGVFSIRLYWKGNVMLNCLYSIPGKRRLETLKPLCAHTYGRYDRQCNGYITGQALVQRILYKRL